MSSIQIANSPSPGTLLIRAQGPKLAVGDIPAIAAALAQDTRANVAILDLSAVSEIDPSALPLLAGIRRGTPTEARLAIVAPDGISEQLARAGITLMIPCHRSLAEATGGTAEIWALPTTRALLAKLTESVAAALKTFGQVDVAAGAPYFRRGANVPQPDIVSSIGIVSDPFSGNLMLGFPAKTYLAVLTRWFGMDVPEINEEYQDGAAEFLNVALGQTKAALNTQGFNIQPALPSVARGKELSLMSVSTSPSMIVPYTSPVGGLYLELCADGRR